MSKRSEKKRHEAERQSRGRMILYSVAALFCLLGLADATYLTVLALTGETAACGGQAGCFEVLGERLLESRRDPGGQRSVSAGIFHRLHLRNVCRIQLLRGPGSFSR